MPPGLGYPFDQKESSGNYNIPSGKDQLCNATGHSVGELALKMRCSTMVQAAGPLLDLEKRI